VPAPLTLHVTNSVEPTYPPPETNPVAPFAPMNPPVIVEPARETNAVVPPMPVPVPAANVAAPSNRVEPPTAVVRTNDMSTSEDDSDSGHAGALILGVGLLTAAGALAAFAFFRARRDDSSSLITRSMRKD
jgi:hypothetical protein